MEAILLALSLLHFLPIPLCERLGSASFRRREAAHKALVTLGRFVLPCIEHNARSHPCAEVRARCARLLVRYESELIERDSYRIRPTSYPCLPWLPLYTEAAERYLAEANRNLGQRAKGSGWTHYREATRLWLRAQLTARRPVEEIVSRLDEMAGQERVWLLGDQHTHPELILPPLDWR